MDISSGKSRQPKPRPGFLACLRNRDHPHRYTDAKWKQKSQSQRFPAFLKCIVISCYFPFVSLKYPKDLYVVTLLPSPQVEPKEAREVPAHARPSMPPTLPERWGWRWGVGQNSEGPKDYPLVMTNIAMERSTIFNGKIHYFDWAIFNSYVSLPEGTWIYSM